jgi:hypothetical protein
VNEIWRGVLPRSTLIILSVASPSTVSNTGLCVPPLDGCNACLIENRVLPLLMGTPVNGRKTTCLPSWYPQFDSSPVLVPGCGSSSTLFSSPSPRLLCHTSCCCIHHSHCVGPILLTILKLPFLNHDSSTTVSSHYCYIQHNSKSPSTLTELIERCNTKNITHLFVGAQMVRRVCKGQRERDHCWTTINNNIRTNYIWYIVGNPFIWYKTWFLRGL